MQLVNSLEHYYELIKEQKKLYGKMITNNCMFPAAIERYVNLKRFWYEIVNQGIVFYSDEDRFYQAYYYLLPSQDTIILKKDKPILFQHIYKEGRKSKEMSSVEAILERSGFQKKDMLIHGVLEDADGLYTSIERSMKSVKRIMDKEGLTFQAIRREQLPEMYDFRKNIQEISYHQQPYFTEEEYEIEAKEERLCCITDRNGRMIAARHLIENGKKVYGWVGIEEKYKAVYGLAIVFLFHALEYVKKNDVKMCSWVKDDNVPSLQYHERIGTIWTGHLEDEWLLE